METTVETEQPATVAPEVDYEAELAKAEQQKEANRQGYAMRHQKVEKPVEDEVDDDAVETERIRKTAALTAEMLQPVIQQATQSNLIDNRLNELSGGNEPLKRLMKFHMDNSVNPSLSIQEKAEMAYAIANKATIEKKFKEANLATQNRQQISNVGQGSNTESAKPGTNLLSEDQKNDLRKIARQIGIDPEKYITDFEKGLPPLGPHSA